MLIWGRWRHLALTSRLPRLARRSVSHQETQSSYEDHLHAAVGFHNPNAMQFLAERQGVLEAKQSLALHLGYVQTEWCWTVWIWVGVV